MKMVMIAMLVWGNGAFAALPSDTAELSDISKDRQTISSWTAHLNHYYPALSLRVRVKLDQDQLVSDALRDLQRLEDNLQGEAKDPARALTTLACKNPVCGDQK